MFEYVDSGTLALFIVGCLLIFGALVYVCIWSYRKWRQKKEYIKRCLERLPEVDYTIILAASTGAVTQGIVTNVGAGNSGMGSGVGSFSSYSAPSTKYLVVYRDGSREIVTIDDSSELGQEYAMRIKLDDQIAHAD